MLGVRKKIVRCDDDNEFLVLRTSWECEKINKTVTKEKDNKWIFLWQ